MAWSSFGGGRQLPPEMEEAAEAKRKEFEAAIASAGGYADGTQGSNGLGTNLRSTSSLMDPEGLGEDLSLFQEALRRYDLMEGDDLDISLRAGSPPWSMNPAHQAAFEAVPKAMVVLGMSSRALRAVASQAGGVHCLAQSAAMFHGSVANCDTADGALAALAGMQYAVALCVRHEAKFYLIAGTLGSAFSLAFYLEKACRTQLLVGAQVAVEANAAIWEGARSLVLEGDLFVAGAEWPAVRAWVAGEGAVAKQMPSCELSLRQALSAAHKELNRRRLDELIWNHCSARLPDEGFLITSGDQLWSRMEPWALQRSSANCAGDILHSAVYAALPSAGAVVHTHSPAIEAVSCLEAGLLEPAGSEFAGRVAYHEWEGISNDWDECERVAADIRGVPGCVALIMRNHGAITFGDSIESALERHLALEAACRETLWVRGEQNFVLEELCQEPLWHEHRPWLRSAL